ncbi:hypothetical protein AAHC03_04840 [Spirometra sp. Aus1]
MDCSNGAANAACECWKSKDMGEPSEFKSPCSSTNCIYAYIGAGHTSFEQFKIQIENLYKFVSTKVLKKLLVSLELKPSKIKIVHKGPCFVSFRSSEDRDQAVAKLNGHVFKGLPLKVRIARPAADPVLLKRAQEADETNNGPTEKRTKMDDIESGSSPNLVNPIDSVAPLWRLTYDPDQIQAKQETALSYLSRLRSAVRKVNTFQYCDTCMRSGFMSSKSVRLTEEFCPISRSPIETGYRNKAEFTIGQDGGGKSPVVGCRLGKYCKGSTRVASPSGLPIFSDSILRVVCQLQGFLDFISNPEAICDHPFMVSPPAISLSETSEGETRVSLKDRALALSRKLRSYDLISRCGHWSSALVRETRLSDRLLRVELHRDNLTDAEINDLQDVMKAWFSPGGPGEAAQLSSLCLSVLSGLSRAPGSFTDNLIFGNGTLTELCCGLKFTISMDAFFQVNTPAAEILYKVIKELCLEHFDPPKVAKGSVTKTHKIDAVLLDICCGTGTIGLCLAECFESVVGIELVAAAVENARQNAELNGITNAKFLAGRAELLLNDVIRGLAPDKQIVAILDPPRAGVHPGVIEVLRRCSRIRQLIFVACDLAAAIPNFVSLARPPSKKFIGDPFLPTLACCVDLFPQTPNIEVVVVLERLPARDCGEDHQF